MSNKNLVQILVGPILTLVVFAGLVCAQTAPPGTSAQVTATDSISSAGQTKAPAASLKKSTVLDGCVESGEVIGDDNAPLREPFHGGSDARLDDPPI